MQDAGQFAAALIRAGTPAYAASAARRLVEGGNDDAFPLELWKQGLSSRLRDLSIALSDGNPDSFAQQVRWSRAAFDAREVSVERLRDELGALREVVREELPDGAREVAAKYLEVALEVLDEPPTTAVRLAADTPKGRLALRYMTALLEGDRRDALRSVIDAVHAKTFTPETILLDVLLPAQRELGRMWHANEIGMAEEHFVTSTTRNAMDRVMALAVPAEPNGKTVVLAAAAGDAHDIGLQAAAHMFELDGWRVVLLGSDLPARELAQAVAHFEPDLLALSATIGWQRASLEDSIRAARGVRPVRVLVGGPAFLEGETLWKTVGADACARTVREAIAVGRKLIGLADR